MTTPTLARQVSPRGAECARRRGRRRWIATPGRPRRGWIRSSGARGNLWSRGVTAREASGCRSRRAVPETETPATTTTTRRRTRRRRRRARCSVRCSLREEAAGGSVGAGGRRRHRQRSRRSARCAWRSSVRATCWRTSPAPTASTGSAPCPGYGPPPAALSAAPPSASPPTNRAQRRRVGRVVYVQLQATADIQTRAGPGGAAWLLPWQRTGCLVSWSPSRPPGCRSADDALIAGVTRVRIECVVLVRGQTCLAKAGKAGTAMPVC